jgi:SAM-dependent methyltransferase
MEDNSEYWSELCGTRAASKLGITAGDPSDSHIFDEWFFYYYPYLDLNGFIPWDQLEDSRVLEVGLGYGSVARRLSVASKDYVGVDISDGPVDFFNATISGAKSSARAIKASALDLPFEDGSFDSVVSIGCLHHTGDLEKAFSEMFRVLKPNGTFVFMVYYAFSYKRWITHPIDTTKRIFTDGRSSGGNKNGSDSGGWWFDRHLDGVAPPHTQFVSKRQVKGMFPESAEFKMFVRNVDNFQDLIPVSMQRRSLDGVRKAFLKLGLGRRFGLDLYLVGKKN